VSTLECASKHEHDHVQNLLVHGTLPISLIGIAGWSDWYAQPVPPEPKLLLERDPVREDAPWVVLVLASQLECLHAPPR
jgi:hypothetical protein